ncbi:MAG: hypothetical protein A3C44_04425 [Gammaproteobacteria bacterium RIFCSPHIGHO2_02_FULL_39_13]|nr:MAG: hypothetical protein A3C44_04425 [Gammaproteobacteria bacterium RIFCSPHIGHO2_02_FULL_39_13]
MTADQYIMNVFEIAALNYPGSIRKRIKFFFRVMLYGQQCVTKISGIFNDPRLKQIILKNPSHYTKIFRPYLHKGLRINDRVLSINNHYEFVKKYWNAKLMHAVYHEKWMRLADISFDKESQFHIVMQQSSKQYENEGELIIGIFNHHKIISVCFNFTKNKNGDRGIYISSAQGSSKKDFPETKDTIKYFTKNMGGMRPQALLIFVLTVIASTYRLKNILAVKTASHIKCKRIKTNLDVLWADMGGTPLDKISYSLPIHYQRKSIDNIKTNKRAMYKRRYAMLDQVENQIRCSLTQR